MPEQQPSKVKLVLAFAAIYLIWGSTFLAIRYAIETLPGFLMASVRFVIAGALLCGWAKWKGAKLAEGHPRRAAFLSGLLLLFLGHGSVVLAVHWVPSGLASLLMSTTPLWVALMEWALPGGRHPGGRVTAGILMSFLGIVILIGVGDLRSGTIDLLGVGILALSSVFWAAGTIYARNAKISSSPLMTSGMQMLWGGVFLFGAAVLNGDLEGFSLLNVSLRSVVALGYLIFFGSILAFTAYSWLVKVTSPARTITSAYVNPVVAVLLGAAAGEPLTYRMSVAMLTIVLGVFVTTNAKNKAT
jgi:drug/metabolite transporter (DMT)-like permease